MKTGRLLFIIVCSITLLSCSKDETIDINNMDVQQYISLLKAEQYNFTELPPFTSDNIPELLAYINETQEVSHFPRNPISSFHMPECNLGIYVLWTIESIRSVAVESEYLIGRFPSLNPILALENGNELELAFNETSHEAVAKAYFDWWEDHKNEGFEDFKNIDPLSGMDYKWH